MSGDVLDFHRVRHDLVLKQRTEENGDETFIIKDRLSNRYWMVGPLQYEIARIFAIPNITWNQATEELQGCFEDPIESHEIAETFEEFSKLGLLELTPKEFAAKNVGLKTYQRCIKRAGLNVRRAKTAPPAVQAFYQETQNEGANTAKLFAKFRQLEQQIGLDPVLRKLGEGFYQAVAEERKAAEKAHLPLFARWIRLQLPLLDPNEQLDTWYPKIKWLFTGTSFFIMALLGFWGFVTYLSHAQEMHGMLVHVASNIPLLIVVTSIMLLLHEYSHAFACKHFGGEVHELGVMMMMLVIPAAYADVSDAHLFESRKARMWVTFAGTFNSFLVASLGAMLWEATDRSSMLNHVGLLFAVTGYAAVVSNFNPLIPLDGYFLMSDFFAIENLRERAPVFAREFIGKWIRRQPLPEAGPGEARVLVGYYLLSWSYQVFYIFVTVGIGWVILVRGGNVATLALYIFVIYRLYLKTYLLKLALLMQSWSRPRLLAATAMTAVCVAALLLVEVPEKFTLKGTVKPGESEGLISPGSGFLRTLAVANGAWVEKNDPLFEIVDPALDASIKRCKGDLSKLEAELSRANAKRQAEEQAVLDEQRRTLKIKQARASRLLLSSKNARNAGLGAATQIDRREQNLLSAASDARVLEASIAAMNADETKQRSVEIITSLIDKQRIRLDMLNARKDALNVKAKRAGWVLFEGKPQQGMAIVAGQSLGSLTESFALELDVPDARVPALDRAASLEANIGAYRFVGRVGSLAPNNKRSERGMVARVLWDDERNLGGARRMFVNGTTGRVKVRSEKKTILLKYLVGTALDEAMIDLWSLS